MQQTVGKHIQRLVGLVIGIIALGASQYWLWGQVKQAAVDLHVLRTAEQQQDILKGRLEEVKADRAQLESSFSQLAVIFPQEGSTTQAVERLEEVADATGVRVDVNSIEQLSPIKPKSGPGLVPLVVALEIAAPVERLLEYIDRIEHVPEAIRIWQYGIEPVKLTEEPPLPSGVELYRLSMRVTFYLQEGN